MASFHDELIEMFFDSYRGKNMMAIAFRGGAKTALKKLFDVFVILNDKDKSRKYIKVLTKDLKNSKQIVTDVYNLMVEAGRVYGDFFEKKNDNRKREETMSSFTTIGGVKYTAGTVGQTQRGHIQDAYRPDWIWFEDVEDRESISSATVTASNIGRIAEAIDGLAKDGNYFITGNYISDQGAIEYFKQKNSVETKIFPILTDKKESAWPTRYSLEDIALIQADADDFAGEYMCDPARSENRFFNIDLINEDIKNARAPIKETNGVKFWGEYNQAHRYGAGSDHSDGIGKDSNALALFDFTTGELMATYANNQISPDMSARLFAEVTQGFGNCILAPEINNKCGGIVITTLKDIEGVNIYRRLKDETVKDQLSKKLGWETNGKTKRTMFFEFRKAYNQRLIRIYDVNVLKEMKAYGNSDLQEEQLGLITRHFDLLTAVVIAWQMEKVLQEETSLDDYNKAVESLLGKEENPLGYYARESAFRQEQMKHDLF